MVDLDFSLDEELELDDNVIPQILDVLIWGELTDEEREELSRILFPDGDCEE